MNIRHLACFLICISCFYVVSAQNPVIEKEYYEFFNSIRKPSGTARLILQSEPEKYNLSGNEDDESNIIDTLFSKSDNAFLKEQAIKANSFIWGPGMITGAKVVNRMDIEDLFRAGVDEGWRKFYKIYGDEGYWVYSVPLFSKDRNICVVKYSNHCGGLCGAGYIYYYKKINGKWTDVYHYMTWIS